MPPFSSLNSSSSGSHSSSSPSSLHSHQSSPPQVKKKRKQNHACDACKSRRIKCDLSDLPGSSSCSKCRGKGIACTTLRILTRAPPKRTGVRIEEAKRIYGSVDVSAPATGGDQVVWNQVAPQALAVFGATPTRTLPQVALCQAVERNLLDVYFASASYRLQVVDPVEFKQRFIDAGQLSQYMSEADQVLCAVLCAYGARYSTNPCILPPDSAYLPPSQVGFAREPVCDILLDRAEMMMDSFGILRTPSKESICALILIMPLLEYRQESRRLRKITAGVSNRVDETRLLSSILAEHVELLHLWEDAEVVGYERARRADGSEELVEVELKGDVAVAQVNSQRTLWAAWISDSLRSTNPRFSDDAIFEICPQIPRLGKPLPDISEFSDSHCFLLLLASWPMLGEILRYAYKNIIPIKNRGPIEKLEKACRVFWRAMDDFGTWFDSLASRLLGSFPTSSTFSPISRYVSIMLSHSSALTLVHRTLSERLESERSRAQSGSSAPYFESASGSSSSSSPSSSNDWDLDEPSPLDKATSLLKESSERCLDSGRSTARLISKIVHTDFMKMGCTELKDLRIITSFLAELPVLETGFHGTRRSSLDWSWSNKARDVSCLREGIEQAGCGWGLASTMAETIRQIMILNTPIGFPPFEPIPTQPRSSALVDLTGSYLVTPSDMEAIYRNSPLPLTKILINTNGDVDGSEARWSTLSDEDRDASTELGRGGGGFELPTKDLFVFPAFTLDQQSKANVTPLQFSGNNITSSSRRSSGPHAFVNPPTPTPFTFQPPPTLSSLPNFQFVEPPSLFTPPPPPPPSSTFPPFNFDVPADDAFPLPLPPNDHLPFSLPPTNKLRNDTSNRLESVPEEEMSTHGRGFSGEGVVAGGGGGGWSGVVGSSVVGTAARIPELAPTLAQEPLYTSSFEDFLASFPTS